MSKETNNTWKMKKEIKDTIDLEHLKNSQYPEDYLHEICDSLVPVYNHQLIDFCSHFEGEEYWDLWIHNELGGDDPLSILRGNLYALYSILASTVLEEIREEEE